MQPAASTRPSDPSDPSNPAELIEAAPTRRTLGSLSRRRSLGLNATQSAQAPKLPADRPRPRTDAGCALRHVPSARLKTRSSSWDKTGGNTDSFASGRPGATLLQATGAGVVTHIWFTINSSIACTSKILSCAPGGTAIIHPSGSCRRFLWAGPANTSPVCPVWSRR